MCVCSLSDRRKALPDPRLPPRRWPFHSFIKGGEFVLPFNSPTWCDAQSDVAPNNTQMRHLLHFVAWGWGHVKWRSDPVDVCRRGALILTYLPCSMFAGHVHRGGCEVLPGRVGSGSGPPPQSGHHLQGPQTWEVRPTLEPPTPQKDSSLD